MPDEPCQDASHAIDEHLKSEGGAAKMLGCRVVGAGCTAMNGWYALDGEYRGKPRYKHEAEDLYIRYGGHMFEGYGISPGREGASGPWGYFCKDSHKREQLHDCQDVPPKAQWETHGGFGAEDPPPSVLVLHATSSGSYAGNLANSEDDDMDQLSYDVCCVVSGAGSDRMNGIYHFDGTYQGKPRYRHAVENDLYIRVGGRVFWGYGITVGRESVPGGWGYFCDSSHNKHNMSDVPDVAEWSTHGNYGAVDPAPIVAVRPLEALTATPDISMDLDLAGMWAIAGDLLWDGVQEFTQTGLCVMIQGDCIHSVCSIDEARRLNVPLQLHEGCCLIPGLIDAHVHMEFNEDYPLHEQPALSKEQLFETMAERARRMVCNGITSARDLGGRNFAALRLRDEILAGRVQGPRFLCAGQPLTSPGGHCHQWGGEVSNLAEAKAAVRRQHEHGTDWIKVMATGGVRTPGTNVEAAQFSTAGLQEIVAEAAAYGKLVAAHAHGTAGVVAAVAAGCKTVEHCSWIANGQWGSVDDSTLKEMARRGVCVAPTAHANWTRRPMGERNYQRLCSALQRLRDAGVPLLASSDSGAIRGLSHDRLAGGIEVLATMAKMSPVEALRSATSVCAQAIGLGDVCGRLAPGLSADVMLVSGDPTQDLSALRRPALVVAAGRLAKPDVEPPPVPPPTFAANRKTTSSRWKGYANATWDALYSSKK